MKKRLFITLVCGISLLMDGCAVTGITASSHLTSVQLNTGNYRIVATNISGEASAKALFGVSYGLGMFTSQLALNPLSENRMLYKTAMENLWLNFEAKHGFAVNRKLALTNMRYDSESLNTLVYTRVSTVVVADVVEFQ